MNILGGHYGMQQMYNNAGPRTRIASLGKRTMENPLKMFYDQIMGAALDTQEHSKLTVFDRHLRNAKSLQEPQEQSSRNHSRAYVLNSRTSRNLQEEQPKIRQQTNQVTRQSISHSQSMRKERRDNQQELESLKLNRDQLSRLSEKIDLRKANSRLSDATSSRLSAKQSQVMPSIVPPSQNSKLPNEAIYTNGFVAAFNALHTSTGANEQLKVQRMSYDTLAPATKLQNLVEVKSRKMSMQPQRLIKFGPKDSLTDMRVYSEGLPERLVSRGERIEPYEPVLPLRSFKKPQPISSIHELDESLKMDQLLKAPARSQQIQSNHDSVARSVRSSRKGSRKTFRSSFQQQEVVFLKQMVTRKDEIRKKLRKHLLGVFWFCCQKKEIGRQLTERKSKHNSYFTGIIHNAIEYVSSQCLRLLLPMIQHIKTFKNQAASQQNSKAYLYHLMEVQKMTIAMFPAFKAMLMEDKATKNILKVFVKEREYLPDGYLTEYELDRIQMSRMFGYPVKTFATSVLFILTFLFVRIITLNLLVNPIKLDPEFFTNPVWKKTVSDLRDCLYFMVVEIIDEEVEDGEFFHRKGNWRSVKGELQYKPGAPLAHGPPSIGVQQLVAHSWSMEAMKVFKNKFPNNWELVKDSIREFSYEVQEYIKTVQIEVPGASRGSKRSQK